MKIRYLAGLFILNQVLGLDYFTTIDDLAREPTRATGDTSVYRIPIDGETFWSWERDVDRNGLIEAFLEYYRRADKEWLAIFYGLPGTEPYDYNIRTMCLNEKVEKIRESMFTTFRRINNGEEAPIWLQNMVTRWSNTLYEISLSTRENPFYDIPPADQRDIEPEYLYPVPMLNVDFEEDFRNAARSKDFPLSRTTADHLHLFFMPEFRGPRSPQFRGDTHIKSRYERAMRYLLNAVEVPVEAGEDVQNTEFQFVVSNLDASLEHRLVTVYVDPNKTTRMRKTLLILRDRLVKIMNQGLQQAWDIRTEMGYWDSRVAGLNKTMEEKSRALDEKNRALAEKGLLPKKDGATERREAAARNKSEASLFAKWQLYKTLILDLTYTPYHLIGDLDAMAEILRVMEVPQLPDTEQSLDLAKDLEINLEPARYMRFSNIDTMSSPVNQGTNSAGYSSLQRPLELRPVSEPPQSVESEPEEEEEEEEGEEKATYTPRDGVENRLKSDRSFENIINIIPVSIDLDIQDSEADSESQMAVQLQRLGSSPTAAENAKLLSMDVSPPGRSLLHPGYSPGPRDHSSLRRSLFSGTGSRFSDAVDGNAAFSDTVNNNHN